MMWEYVGTLFACVIAFVLGYKFGRLKKQRDDRKKTTR